MTEIVAEISGNHGGKLENAHRLIEAAADAGADAVKFQCFEPWRLAARRRWRPDVEALAGGVPLLQLYQKIHTPKPWFRYMIAHARDLGIAWFSSVFDPLDVAYLEELDCPRYKISAFEMLDWDIIKAVRETGKPIVMSVRPTTNVTVLHATDYNGKSPPIGLSAHGKILPWGVCPMAEYHLRLEDVDTPDKDFSLTVTELKHIVGIIRR